MEAACAQYSLWQANDMAPPVLAMDVFGGQLRVAGDIADDMTACLDKHDVDAARLELEVDESAFSQGFQRCPEVLEGLHQKGFRLAISNFGNGSSSIRGLAATPVQRLKIPRDIVDGIPDDTASVKAVQAAVGIAREIGATVIAAGVTTQTQVALLLAAGCEQGQGPFFGPSLSGMEATLLLRNAVIERPSGAAEHTTSAAQRA